LPLALVVAAAMAGCSTIGGTSGAASTSPTAGGTASRTTSAAPPSTAAVTTTAKRRLVYVFPVQPIAACQVSYGHFHHDYPATDIFSKRGCGFVAPTSGVVTEVTRTDVWDPKTDKGADRGGRSVAMVGDDGVRYYGSHLLRVEAGIAPGTRVRAGQRLGLIDNSGDARYVPTHLHFGISWKTPDGVWWVRRGMVYPWPFLDAWRAGRPKSPAAAVRAALAKAGQRVPPCRSGC
jgi:murein DD-endopeptidase MepM/ murein hydrolase activator NlpD